MKIYEQRVSVPRPTSGGDPLKHLESVARDVASSSGTPIRVAVTKSSGSEWEVELGTASSDRGIAAKNWRSIFGFRKRGPENQSQLNVALILPTGIGAEIGGHAGDAGAVAKLFAACSDRVITHPNVVNASDINELPSNGLYVEGSILSRLLMGEVGLREVRANRVLTIVDDHPEKHLVDHVINSVGAARATMGMECPITARLSHSLEMVSEYTESGRAAGEIRGVESLLEILEEYHGEYDAIAISSRIQVPKSFHHEYYLGGLVNPWGGVEAMLTHAVSTITGLPSAHAPMMESEEILNLNLGVVDPRMAAEVVSVTYLNCVLKGLQRSPQVVWDSKWVGARGTLWAEDISAVVIPKGCLGLPTLAAIAQEIPVIEVQENKNLMENSLEDIPHAAGKLIQVRSYAEAAGVVSALRAGISMESLKRPLGHSRVEPTLREERAEELGDVIRLRSI